MNIIVVGHKQHGKDELCKLLDLPYRGSEYACEKFIFDEMKEAGHVYDSIAECHADRGNHREFWFKSISNYNTPDLSRLVNEAFSDGFIYCGLRCIKELNAVKESGTVDLIVWVDACERKPLESKKSMTITKEDADIIILNNGTLEEFHHKAAAFKKLLGLS